MTIIPETTAPPSVSPHHLSSEIIFTVFQTENQAQLVKDDHGCSERLQCTFKKGKMSKQVRLKKDYVLSI